MKRFLKGIFVIVFLISVYFFSMFVGPGQILHEKIHFCIKKWKKKNFINFYKKVVYEPSDQSRNVDFQVV